MVAAMHRPSYPLHDSVKDRLHPDYVAFYNKYLLHEQPAHHRPVALSRQIGSAAPTGTEPLPVGRTQDVGVARRDSAGPDVPVRCFTPPGTPPTAGWPVVLYFHGGGWVFGGIDTENNLCSHVCLHAGAVVVTTDYRLAPEHPWPAAIHDAWETYLWTISQGAGLLKLDRTRIAVAGASAGANIAAVLAQKAALRPDLGVALRAQVLVVPITDNTATPTSSPSWKAFEHAAGLPAQKMLWYRRHYLPNEEDWCHREASPLLAGDDVLARLPPAHIIVGELDVLRHDGEEYARRLVANHVPARLTVMDGMPHAFLAMDAVLEAGRQAFTMVSDDLARALD